MKTQIVYVLVSSEKDLFLEELWASIYSLRQFHPKKSVGSDELLDASKSYAKINVLVDDISDKHLRNYPELLELIDEVVVGNVPENYSPKERSRELKTRIREYIKGDFFYIDTDTIICKALDGIDEFSEKEGWDVAGVPDSNLLLKDNIFADGMTGIVENIFGNDITHNGYLVNGGVLFVKDSEPAYELFKRWNENWTFSSFEKGKSQDQPALWQSDYEMGNIIKLIPDIYNSQVAMGLKYFSDAAIVHFLHMDFISNQDYSPFLGLQIYKNIKAAGSITKECAEQIINCKSQWAPMTIPVGRDEMAFLFTEAGKIFVRIYKGGGVASALMLKLAGLLNKLYKYTRKR